MRVIIAGSRHITDYDNVFEIVIQSPFFEEINTIISGMADGVDKLAIRIAEEIDVPLLEFPANWKLHGKSAGYIRNREMADNADALIAIWDGKSPGTRNMILEAQYRHMPTYVYLWGK